MLRHIKVFFVELLPFWRLRKINLLSFRRAPAHQKVSGRATAHEKKICRAPAHETFFVELVQIELNLVELMNMNDLLCLRRACAHGKHSCRAPAHGQKFCRAGAHGKKFRRAPAHQNKFGRNLSTVELMLPSQCHPVFK